MKTINFLFLLLVATQVLAQPNEIANVYNRKITPLNGVWTWNLAPETGYKIPQNDPKSNQSNAKNLAGKLNIPAAWNGISNFLFSYESGVTFSKSFDYTLPEGKRLFLYFGASNYLTNTKFNAYDHTAHRGGFTPFNIEISRKVKTKNNLLQVTVSNKRRADEVPALMYDWLNYGGITNDVLLVELPETFIQNYHIQLGKNNPGSIVGWLRLKGDAASQKVTIEIPEAGIKEKMKTNEDGFVTFNFRAKGIESWSPENPKLYKVIIRSETDVLEDKIGFRTIEAIKNKLVLNGKNILLRGIGYMDELSLTASRMQTAEDFKKLIQQVKDLNCNFLRVMNCPANELLVRLADEAGIMIQEEIPVYGNIKFEDDYTQEIAGKQLKDLIERDRNRASVIIWSIGNETAVGEKRNEIMNDLLNLAHKLDVSRLVTAGIRTTESPNVLNTKIIDDPIGELCDVITVSDFTGWLKNEKMGYAGIPYDCKKVKWEAKYDKPHLFADMGAGANYGTHGDTTKRWSEELQEALVKNQIEMVERLPSFAGLSLCPLYDFRTMMNKGIFFRQGYNRRGLLSEKGEKKKGYLFLKAYYEKQAKKKS